MRHPRLDLPAAAVLGVLAVGCLGRSRPAEFFTLSPMARAEERGAVAARPDLGLGIGPVQFPRYLDRPEIVTRDGEHQLVLGEWHRWGGSLRTDILRSSPTISACCSEPIASRSIPPSRASRSTIAFSSTCASSRGHAAGPSGCVPTGPWWREMAKPSPSRRPRSSSRWPPRRGRISSPLTARRSAR